MEHENQVIMESEVKGNLNLTKQKGNIKAKSKTEGNLNYTSQEFIDKSDTCHTTWWTKTHVLSAVGATIIAGLTLLHACGKL